MVNPQPGRPLTRIFSSASWYLLEKLVRLLGAFLVGAWVARHLGPETYGALAYALAMVATLGFLGSLGVESLVVRDLTQGPSRQRQVVSSYFFVRLLGAASVPVLVSGYLLITHPGDTELLAVALLSSGVVLLAATDAADCWLQSRHQSRATSLIRLSGFVVGAAIKCLLVLAGADVVWFAAAGLVEAGVIACLYLRLLRCHDILPAFSFWDMAEVRRLLVDGRMMILSGLTVVIYSKIDVLAIGGLLSKEELGPYAIAASMCAAWNMVGMSLVQAWAPHISTAKSDNMRAYVSTLRRLLAVTAAVSVVGSLFLGTLSSWIFDLLLGPAYEAGARVFSVLVWTSVPVFLGVATSQMIVNEKVYWVSLARTLIGMLMSIVLISPIALRWGVVGVAGLMVASAAVATLAIALSRSMRRTLRMVFGFGEVARV